MKLSIINVSYENEILHEGYGKQLGVAPGVPTMKGAYGDPENTKRGYKSIIDTLGNHDVPQGWIQTPRPNTTPNTNPGPPVSWNDPSNPDDPQAGYGYIPNDTTCEETFFYHSDHLGSTSYITDDKANITQYDAYLPYGELLVDEHSSSEDLPYKFNGKQFDEETGLYYYGARYLNPVTSLWYGVDPLVENNPNISSYIYCDNNPIRFIDLIGKEGENANNSKGGNKTVRVYISEKKWKYIYMNHKRGIAKGNPTLLTYDSSNINAARRTAALKASGISSSSQVDRDEYPYAHTEEGGSNASVMQVPRSENRSHGQYLSTLVKSNNMKTGDHFLIILVPDNSKKEKQHIPIGSTVPVTEKIHPNRDVVKNIAIGTTVVAFLKV